MTNAHNQGEAQQPSDQTQFSARNLARSFGGREVVSNVSLSVGPGEIVGLLGPNGSGKTTCFYMMIGLIRVDRGEVRIGTYDVTRLPMYQRARLGVGYLPQENSIFRGLSVEKNILCTAQLAEPDPHKAHDLVETLMEEFDITRLRDANANALSGGERRRVEIARALASQPRFLMLDEPFSGIDPLAVSEISGLILDLRRRGLGILITDHQVRETLEIVDRAVVIYGGRVLFEGPSDKVLSDENVRRVYLGDRFTS